MSLPKYKDTWYQAVQIEFLNAYISLRPFCYDEMATFIKGWESYPDELRIGWYSVHRLMRVQTWGHFEYHVRTQFFEALQKSSIK